MKKYSTLAIDRSLLLPLLALTIGIFANAQLAFGETPKGSTSKLPTPGPQPSIKAPVPEVVKLSNGIELWHLELHHVPLISLNISLPSGSMDDPKGKSGLAALTAALLDEGTEGYDALQISDTFDLLGASFSVSADKETSGASLQVLTRNLEPALELMASIVLKPSLKDDDWARLKPLWINSLKNSQVNPNLIARQINYRIVYGDDHPYAHPTSGYISTVSSLTLDDVKTFYKTHWASNGVKIISSGAISTGDLQKKLETHFGNWKADASLKRAEAPAYPSNAQAPKIVVHNIPGSVQTVVRISAPGIARKHADYEGLNLANVIFGGSFTSRLQQNLRVKHQFTYGAGSNFTRMRGEGVFLSAAQVRTDVTAKAIIEFRREFQTMANGKVTEAESKKAIASIRSSMMKSLQSLGGTSSLIASLAEAGLPPSHLQAELDKYAQIEKDTSIIGKAASAWINWDKASIFLVGDLEAIKKTIEAEEDLKLGDIVEVDNEGNVVQ